MLVDVKDKFASLGIVKILKNKIDELEKWNDKGRLEGSEKGINSIAFGYETTASGKYSYANGWKNVASGDYSQAEGLNTTASGYNSHSEGRDTIASGDTAHTEGSGTIASCNNQHTEGSYNIEDTEGKYLHIVGNGTSDNDRSNAHTLDRQGNAWYAGDISNGTGSLNGVLNSTNINLYPESGFIYIDNLGEHIADINLEPGVYTCSCETSTTDYNFITFTFTDSDGEPVCEDCILEGNGSYVNTINLSEYGANKVKIRAASSMTIFNVQIEKGETKSDYQPYVKSINAIYERIDSKDKDLNDLNNKVSKLISCTIQARNFDSSVELTNLITALENNFQESTIGSTFNSTETDSTSSFWFGLKASSSSGIALIISNLGLIYAVRKNSLNNDPTAWYIDDSKILSIPKTIIE